MLRIRKNSDTLKRCQPRREDPPPAGRTHRGTDRRKQTAGCVVDTRGERTKYQTQGLCVDQRLVFNRGQLDSGSDSCAELGKDLLEHRFHPSTP